jgi:hypothetical protein
LQSGFFTTRQSKANEFHRGDTNRSLVC